MFAMGVNFEVFLNASNLLRIEVTEEREKKRYEELLKKEAEDSTEEAENNP